MQRLKFVQLGIFSLYLLQLSNPLIASDIGTDSSALPKSEVTLQTYTLHDCYQYALRQSESVAMKKEDIGKTISDFLNATSQTLGHISYVRTDLRQDAPDSSGSSSDEGSSVGGTFSAKERVEGRF